MAKPKVFISYRRADLLAKGSVGSIRDALTKSLGAGRVFMDMHDVRPGQDFRAVLAQRVKEADALLAILGPQWLELMDAKQADPDDWVRLEIETALKAKIPVIPVLLGETKMPRKDQLPESIADLAYLHATVIEPGGREFARQMAELTKDLERAAKTRPKKEPVPAPAKKFVVRPAGGNPRKPAAAKPSTSSKKSFIVLAVLALIGLGAVALFQQGSAPEESPAPVVPKPMAQPTPPPAPPEPVTPRTATKDKPFVNSLGMRFVPVPGTDVLFCVWETRVQDYAAYAAANPGKVNTEWKEYSGHNQVPDHPVVNVNWEDAKAFCDWLSQKDGVKYRLPTDHEWSVAVGIGGQEDASASPKDKSMKLADVYPWGSAWPPPKGAGNFSGQEIAFSFVGKIEGYQDDFPFTAPVGSFSANSPGLFDLSGNVYEWCEDWYDPKDQSYRVLRGGSWYYYVSDYLLSSCRYYYAPTNSLSNVGFRCVVVAGSGG